MSVDEIIKHFQLYIASIISMILFEKGDMVNTGLEKLRYSYSISRSEFILQSLKVLYMPEDLRNYLITKGCSITCKRVCCGGDKKIKVHIIDPNLDQEEKEDDDSITVSDISKLKARYYKDIVFTKIPLIDLLGYFKSENSQELIKNVKALENIVCFRIKPLLKALDKIIKKCIEAFISQGIIYGLHCQLWSIIQNVKQQNPSHITLLIMIESYFEKLCNQSLTEYLEMIFNLKRGDIIKFYFPNQRAVDFYIKFKDFETYANAIKILQKHGVLAPAFLNALTTLRLKIFLNTIMVLVLL